MRSASTLRLTGRDLTVDLVAAVARCHAKVELDPEARRRIETTRAVIEQALAEGKPVYGLTTGLGQRVDERVDRADAADFSLRTLRGRATSVGEPLPIELVRAAMTVRLNGLCAGGAGVGLDIAEGIRDLLNARVHPRILRSGSVGAADVCLLAHLGLTLVGEGEAELGGEWLPSAKALAGAGLVACELDPKDGLAP